MREEYAALVSDPAGIERTLLAGAERARALATPFLREVRAAVGLRPLTSGTTPAAPAKTAKLAKPSFKQYREADGQFYFKLVAADGRLLLQSTGFGSPKDAGQTIARLQQDSGSRWSDCVALLAPVDGVADSDVLAALQALADAAA